MSIKNIKLKPVEENLSEANMKKVISLLFPTDTKVKAITKKLACEHLGISYNTARLDKLITTFKERETFRERKMSENRGKPADIEEIKYIIKEYMSGSSITQIAKDLYRGIQFVHTVLEKHEVPKKPKTQDYFKPELIPDSASRNEFALNEIVYSARYDSLAKILFEAKSSNGEKVYNILLTDEKWQMRAYQPASELASLDSIRKLGVVL